MTITSLDTGSKRSVKTDEGGRFNFPQLKLGAYEVEIEAQGFEPQVAGTIFSGGVAVDAQDVVPGSERLMGGW